MPADFRRKASSSRVLCRLGSTWSLASSVGGIERFSVFVWEKGCGVASMQRALG